MVVALSPERTAQLLKEYHARKDAQQAEEAADKQLAQDRYEAIRAHCRKVDDEISDLAVGLYSYFISTIAEPYILTKSEKGKHVCCRLWVANIGVTKAQGILKEQSRGL
jgi:hypothetical protein